MRALGLDIGEKRIGIARTDPSGTIAVPYVVHRRRDPATDVEALAKICAESGVEALVVGLPLNADGTESAQAKLVRSLAEAVASRTGLPLFYVDERWTTKEAERAMREAGQRPSRRKEKVDVLSAVLILQAWLEQNR